LPAGSGDGFLFTLPGFFVKMICCQIIANVEIYSEGTIATNA